MATCEDRVKSKRRERERGKERNGLVEWEMEHLRYLEMALIGNDHRRKGTPENFKQIKWIEQIQNQSNGILIILGGSLIHCALCCDFCSLNDASHHTLQAHLFCLLLGWAVNTACVRGKWFQSEHLPWLIAQGGVGWGALVQTSALERLPLKKVNSFLILSDIWAVFTKLHFLLNLRMNPISLSLASLSSLEWSNTLAY